MSGTCRPPRARRAALPTFRSLPLPAPTKRSYYCKYSGKHALTTNCNLNSAPRRRADHSLVVDTTKYTVRLYTTDGGVKHIRRQ